jgi:hypothetical protein
MKIQQITIDPAPYKPFRLAQGYRVGELLFISGQEAIERNMQRVDDATLLTYRVAGRWAHEEEKRLALASNVYVKRDGAWKLACHQQTPLDAG